MAGKLSMLLGVMLLLVSVLGCRDHRKENIANTVKWTEDWIANLEYLYLNRAEPAPGYGFREPHERKDQIWFRSAAVERIEALRRGREFLLAHMDKPFDEPWLMYANFVILPETNDNDHSLPLRSFNIEWFECASPEHSDATGFYLQFADGSESEYPNTVRMENLGSEERIVWRENLVFVLEPDAKRSNFKNLKRLDDTVSMSNETVARLLPGENVKIGLLLKNGFKTPPIPLTIVAKPTEEAD